MHCIYASCFILFRSYAYLDPIQIINSFISEALERGSLDVNLWFYDRSVFKVNLQFSESKGRLWCSSSGSNWQISERMVLQLTGDLQKGPPSKSTGNFWKACNLCRLVIFLNVFLKVQLVIFINKEVFTPVKNNWLGNIVYVVIILERVDAGWEIPELCIVIPLL